MGLPSPLCEWSRLITKDTRPKKCFCFFLPLQKILASCVPARSKINESWTSKSAESRLLSSLLGRAGEAPMFHVTPRKCVWQLKHPLEPASTSSSPRGADKSRSLLIITQDPLAGRNQRHLARDWLPQLGSLATASRHSRDLQEKNDQIN